MEQLSRSEFEKGNTARTGQEARGRMSGRIMLREEQLNDTDTSHLTSQKEWAEPGEVRVRKAESP